MPAKRKADHKGREKGFVQRELLETAARLFNERGFHGTSLQMVANELGVTKTAIYHYVPSKLDLLYRVHEISLQTAEDSLASAIAEGKDGAERIRLMVYYYLKEICASPTSCFFMVEQDSLSGEQAVTIAERRRKLERETRDLVLSGIKDGSIVPCDPKAATFVLVGAMNWVTKWYQPGGDWDAAQVADGISAIIARSLALHPSATLPTNLSRPELTPFSDTPERSDKTA